METVKNIKETLKKTFGEKNKGAGIILMFGICGLCLILISEFLPDKEKQAITLKETDFEQEITAEDFENRLANIISKIEGAGKTEVMLTFDSSKEYFYAQNNTEDIAEGENARETEIVVIDGENGEEPIVFKTAEAKIRGILVVCEGGKNALVREKIISALCALLDIPSTRVSVAKMA